MEQTENVSISVNEYESSASLQNTVTKRVRVSPRSIERFEKTADSLSLSSVSFKVPISDSQLISRRMIFEFPISLTIDSGADARNMRNCFLCPRADLNRIFNNITVKVNGSSITSRPQDYAEVVQFFSKESDHYRHGGLLSSSPVVPDILYSNGLGQFTGDAASQPDLIGGLDAYHFKTENYDTSFPSRAAVQPFTKLGTTDVAGGGTRSVGFTYFVRVALKNDIFSASSLETLCNIQDLEVQISFNVGVMKQKLFHMTVPYHHNGGAPAAIPDGNVQAQIGTLTAVGVAPNQLYNFQLNASDFKLIGMVINPSIQDIPELSIVPSTSWTTFDYPISGAVADNADTNIVHTSINLSQVPSYIFISCVPQETSLSSRRPDYHCPIKNLNIQINNRTYPFELWTERDFYQMNCENGYKQMFQSFNSAKTSKYGDITGAYIGTRRIGVGAPLCFRLASNFGGELKESLNEQFRLEVRYTASNTSGVALNLVSRINVVLDSVFLLQRGTGLRQLNGVSKEEFADALSRGSYVTLGMDNDKDEQGELMGGGNFSNVFRDAGRGLIRALNVGNQLLQTAAQIYPETGVGQAAFEVNRANRLAQAMNQNLNLGAGSMMGGSRLDMLKASGVLR